MAEKVVISKWEGLSVKVDLDQRVSRLFKRDRAGTWQELDVARWPLPLGTARYWAHGFDEAQEQRAIDLLTGGMVR